MGAVQIDTKYTLTGPDGTVAVFNDPTDPNYVGVLTEITGLDSPEVRESADDLVQMDGGIHGDFFYGRRPMVLTGIFLNPASATDRNTRQDRLMRATNALRGNATLRWTPSGGVEQFLALRRQQPLRVEGNWQKQFQVALVAADPRIYSWALNSQTVSAASGGTSGRAYSKSYSVSYPAISASGQLFVVNAGNTETFPTLIVTGPGSNPVLTNQTSGKSLYLTYTLGAGEYLEIDTLNRTVLLMGSTSRYGAINFALSDWWGLVPGQNDVRLGFSSSSAGASLEVRWRDAWV